jgi:hypothetical protein
MPVLCVAEPRLSCFSDVEPCRTSVMHGAWRHVCAAATHARLSVQTAATTKPAEEQPPSNKATTTPPALARRAGRWGTSISDVVRQHRASRHDRRSSPMRVTRKQRQLEDDEHHHEGRHQQQRAHAARGHQAPPPMMVGGAIALV